MKEFIDIMADCFFTEYEENIAYDKAEKAIADHDKQIRDEVVIETLESVIKMIADWGYQDLTSVVLRENLKARIEQMKGEQNE